MSQRKIIIGDVHGCYDELKKLLEKAKFDEAADKLIFVGDLMDRGPKSYEVFDFVRTLKNKMRDRLVVVKGNHEQMFMDIDEFWEMNGGNRTKSSFREHGDNALKHRAWFVLNTVPYYVDPEDDFQVVHAGLYGDPAETDEEVLIWDREALEKGMYDGKLTFSGHTPVRHPLLSFQGTDGPHHIKAEYDIDYDIAPSLGLLCIDQGCVFGGNLTAAIVQNRSVRLIHVESGQKRKGEDR